MSLKDTRSWKNTLESSERSSIRQKSRDNADHATSDDRFRKYGGARGRETLENKRKEELASLVSDIIKDPPSALDIRELRKKAVNKVDESKDKIAITSAFTDIEAYVSEVSKYQDSTYLGIQNHIEEVKKELQNKVAEKALSSRYLQKALEKLANHEQRSSDSEQGGVSDMECDIAIQTLDILHTQEEEIGNIQEQNPVSMRQQGSWESLLGEVNWETSQKFWNWKDPANPWSADKAVVKEINETNKDEFQKMQELKIPGTYLRHKSTGDYMYIPIRAANIYTKIGTEYNYNEHEKKYLRDSIHFSLTRDGKHNFSIDWDIVKHLARPNLEVKSPRHQTTHFISPDGLKDYFDEKFKGKDNISIPAETFQQLIPSERRKSGGFERMSSLPLDDSILDQQTKRHINKRKVTDTPIIWKCPQDTQ